MEVITTTPEEKALCDRISPEYLDYAEGDSWDRDFLTSVISRKKPVRLLELGVSAGASSVVLLNAIKDIENARLYSIDYLTQYYRQPELKSGFIVDKYPELAKKWKIFTGGMASEFMDAIQEDIAKDSGGNGLIDFVFIDTMHRLPGEILDFLLIYPYLKKGCTVVLHDTKLYYDQRFRSSIASSVLISTLKGKKISPGDISNISGVTLDRDTDENLWDIFNALSLPWSYFPTDKDLEDSREAIGRWYSSDLLAMFNKIIDWQVARPEMAPMLAKARGKRGAPSIPRNKRTILNYLRYSLLSKILIGKRRKYYQEKVKEFKTLITIMSPVGDLFYSDAEN